MTPANRAEPKNGGESDSDESVSAKTPPEITTFRWVSNASGITFSVPASFLPPAESMGETESAQADEMEVDKHADDYNTNPHPARPAIKCSVKGCDLLKKYRLVRKFDTGACGIEHLKLLDSQLKAS